MIGCLGCAVSAWSAAYSNRSRFQVVAKQRVCLCVPDGTKRISSSAAFITVIRCKEQQRQQHRDRPPKLACPRLRPPLRLPPVVWSHEIAAVLIAFERHADWQSKEVKIRPKSGSMLLYSRKKVRYRRDGYCWKKRKDGKTTREDHMKLKVQGTECIYGCYVHSAILPTFHRRCYWLLQNPDIVLVHYLNVPYPDDNKMVSISPSLALWGDKKEWTKEELVSQLKPMCESLGRVPRGAHHRHTASHHQMHPFSNSSTVYSEDEPDHNNELEISTAETVESIVTQLMERQRAARSAALAKQLECGCPDSTCADGKTCSHPIRRITSAKPQLTTVTMDRSNQVSSTTGTGSGTLITQTQRHHATQHTSQHTAQHTAQHQIHLSETHQQQLQQRVTAAAQQQQLQQHHHQAGQLVQQAPPLVLSLSQIQTSSLLILNNAANGQANLGPASAHQHQVATVTSFVRNVPGVAHLPHHPHHHHHLKPPNASATAAAAAVVEAAGLSGKTVVSEASSLHAVMKQEQEAMDMNTCRMAAMTAVSQSSSTVVSVTSHNMDVTNGNIADFVMYDNIGFSQETQHLQVVSSATNQQAIHVDKAMSSPPSPSKQMDTRCSPDMLVTHQTFCDDAVGNESCGNKSSGTSGANSSSDGSTTAGFFDALEMTQEDIQRTLSANMPMSCASDQRLHTPMDTVPSVQETSPDEMSPHDLNPMDFIEGCEVVSGAADDEDVFVNLDAFDMLGDFVDIDGLDNTAENSSQSSRIMINSENSESPSVGSIELTHQQPQYQEQTTLLEIKPDHDAVLSHLKQEEPSPLEENQQQQLQQLQPQQINGNVNSSETSLPSVEITEYSPEWAYPEGGVKVLVTGPWYSSSPYTVLFDTFPVSTTLVQDGVLRCYCPAHEVGLATLQVACDGHIVSNSVMFEYKEPPKSPVEAVGTALQDQKRDTADSNSLLKLTLLHRLEAVNQRLHIKQEQSDHCSDLMESVGDLEERLVARCRRMSSCQWKDVEMPVLTSHRNMTLLHLAAALGYPRLICALIHWREENSSPILDLEVDALSKDEVGFTPLMWSCSKGHNDAALALYRWNHSALDLVNIFNQSALDVARLSGFTSLASEVTKLKNERLKTNALSPSSQSNDMLSLLFPPSPSPSSGLSPCSSVVSIPSSAASSSASTCTSASATGTDVSQDSLLDTNSWASLSSSRSHDGVFLRPLATRTRSDGQKLKNLELQVNIPPSTSAMLNNLEAATESEPGEIRQSQSLKRGSHHLVKRPSVDSGINLGSVQSVQSSCDSLSSLRSLRSNRFNRDNSRISRFDRSMSLPLNSPKSASDLFGSNGCNSPARKGDFSLCEVTSGDRSDSPLIDIEGVSDEDSESRESVVGQQEVRVLTLAEQIIAAIPERIKNGSDDSMMSDDSSSPGDQKNEGLDVFMDSSLLDEPPSSAFESNEFNFEFSDHNYRYYDVSTPSSSLSPSSSCLQSPCSFVLEPSPSPPPTTADFCEFFQASGSLFEKDFSNLTLSDREQRELYEAAKIIQKAYRSYKGRKIAEEQEKERAAAILIQNYYRRYKQYAYFKQMTHAATVIQNGFRSYQEHKRFKKSKEAAVCIQTYYRNYRDHGGRSSSSSPSFESTPSSGLKRTYSQRRQHQAARKIQQFMRQSKNNDWDVSTGQVVADRTSFGSRKREAVGPVGVPGCPPKVALSRNFGLIQHRSK
ncbi:calmodulin-binding transcription activator 1 isoform X4 [Thrips palmi]|uniref:Calmodulin-binding transcription activator 1 isoform X4 n=1 Tax=Thrips palmi TaxID=161013 RepID=A0A6P8Z5H1_THRPL|nr:calmodulin-binding transcription activator 1 isoform X4 [Thrips palmi]